MNVILIVILRIEEILMNIYVDFDIDLELSLYG